MSAEYANVLEAILQELREIKQEMQALRTELREPNAKRPDKELPLPSIAEVKPKTILPIVTAEGVTIENPTDSQVVPAAEVKPPEDGSIKVVQWLESHKITVKNYKQQTAADAIFDQVAIFLGERFDSVRKVHDQIRKTLSTGSSFKVNFSSCTQEEIANSTQLCTILHEYAFLSSYRYHKTSKTISATPQRVGNVINFFSGGWYERFIFLKVIALLKEQKKDHLFLLNPQIALPSGDDFELDLFFLVNNEPVWIECKTGDYQPHIVKYSNVRKTLAIPKERSVLTILGIPDQLTAQLTNVYNVVVVNESNFLSQIADIVAGSPVNPEPPQPPSVI